VTSWSELPVAEDHQGRGWGGSIVGRLVPPLAIAVVLWLLGLHELALVVAVVGTVIGVVGAIWPAFARGFDRALLAVGHYVGRFLTIILLGLFEVFVVAPVALITWLFRRDPLDTHARRREGGLWSLRGDDEPVYAPRPYAHEPSPERGKVGKALVLVPRVVGWVAIVVALDLVVGSVTRSDATEIPVTERLEAATADLPWFDDYRAELESVEYEVEPFVLSRPVDRQGAYINIEQGLRRTVAPSTPTPDAPVVWIFGGSPAWGEGQRDEHTIASELAALGHGDGTPIQVVNWAQRGDSAFVGAQRFERALAHNEAPDLVLFLDGPDDVNIQAEHVTGNPSQYNLEEAEQAVRRDDRSLFQRYEDTSVMFSIGQSIRNVFAVAPAWAGDADTAPSTVTAEEIAEASASVYLRSRNFADIVAEQHGVEVRYYWLPVAASDDERSTYREAASRLDERVTVMQALDESDGPVFLDAVHTNEAGARQVAEALYDDIRPALSGSASG
jgi:hypothetical protein